MDFKALFQSLKRHQVFSLSAGVLVGQVLNLAFMPLLTRLYHVESFGKLAIYLSVSTLFGVFGTFRYEIAIPVAANEEDAGALMAMSMGLVSAVGFLFMGLYWTPAVALLPQLMRTWPVWLFTTISILATGYVQVFGQVALRHARIQYTSYRFIAEKIGFLGFSIFFGNLGWTENGLLVAQTIGVLMSACTLWLGARVQRANFSRSDVLKCLKRYKAVSGYGSGATGFQLGTAQIPVMILANYFSIEALGYLNLAQRIVEAPLSFVTSAFGVAYYRRNLDAGREHLPRIYRRAMGWTLLLFGLPALIIAPMATPLMVFVFGQKWASSGPYLMILFLPTLCRMAYTLQQTMTFVLQQFKVDFGVAVFVFFAQMTGIFVGISFDFSLLQTVLCGACFVSFAYILGLTKIYRIIKASG